MPYFAFCHSCNATVWVEDSGCQKHGTTAIGPLHVVDDMEKQTLHLFCPNCRKPTALPESASSFRCSSCGTGRTFVRCRRCGECAFVPDKPSGGVPGSFVCPDCDAAARPRDSMSTAGEYAASLDQRGVERPLSIHGGADRALRMMLIGVGGVEFEAGTPCELQFRANGFEVRQEKKVVRYAYDELLRLQVGGRGLRETSLGLIGGGFGVEGAVKGMVAASIINSLTSRSSIDTNLQVGVMDAEFLLHTDRLTPEQLRTALADVFVKFNKLEYERHTSSPRVAEETAVEQLERAHTLLSSGAVTQDEYDGLKRRILE